ncbi:MAG TPA: fructosamine kinase family protein, partial [Anaerolineae bacterium]|nr:fructosamine kinase family protein [Anaerolineae bacterium]
MTIPLSLLNELRTVLGTDLEPGTGVGGGCINNATRARLGDGREVLVKWRGRTPPGMFTVEQRGLSLLAASQALRVPQVYAADDPAADRPGFIVLEWLGRGSTSPRIDETLGQGLAQLHRTTGPHYGLDHDNYIGANPQPNTPGGDWVSFFGQQRLGYQMELAAQNGYLSSRRRQLLERLIGRLSDFLP